MSSITLVYVVRTPGRGLEITSNLSAAEAEKVDRTLDVALRAGWI